MRIINLWVQQTVKKVYTFREYCLTVKIGPGFPDASAVSYTTDDIPTTGGGADHSWYNKFNEFNLGSLYSEFVRQIDTLAPLRKALRDLDTHTWVLDPPPPVQGLNHLYRRIVVSKGRSALYFLNTSIW